MYWGTNMAVTRGWVRALPLTVEAAADYANSPAKLFSPVFGRRHGFPAVPTRIPQRCMAAKARARSEEEKKARKAAREETTAAHKQFPFLPMKCARQVYVLDKSLAGEVARAVIKNQSDPSTPILEANPGPGILTKALLKAGARHVVLAESLKGFMPYVQGMQKECGPRIAACYHLDYLSAWRQAGDSDSAAADWEVSMTALFPCKDWTAGPPVSVVAVLTEQKERGFLNQLIGAHSRQHHLFSLGRPEWFLALSPPLYTKLVAVKMEQRSTVHYNHLAIVLHLLFDIRLCAQLPGWKFTPRFPEKRVLKAGRNKPDVSNSMRYLVRFRPHVDQPLAPAEVPEFHSFLAQIMQKKKVRLIPKMEQLVPGCGPHLIKQHFTMMTLVADMDPLHFLNVFKAMRTWPEYQGSPLKQLLSSVTLPTAEDDGAEDPGKEGGAGEGSGSKGTPTEAVKKDS